MMLLLMIACDDFIFEDKGGGELPTGEGFCAVKSVFGSSCLSCHSAGAALGGLDLETDAWTALVGVESAGTPGRILVVEGDATGSLLYRKLAGTQAGDEGGLMPPTSALPASTLAVFETWINDGASADCGDTGTTIPSTYHTEGWADPGEHGMAAKYQEDTCLECHGADLLGGSVGVSCNTCHTPSEPESWQTDCTFCHGGNDGDTTGAPPRDIDNQAVDLSFSPHSSHVNEGPLHVAFDCTQCHTKPLNVLSSGHFLVSDATPGVAETMFGDGLSPAASWSGTGCSNLYCHGDGQGNNGAITVTDTVPCGECHAVSASGENAWDQMSGNHKDHLEEGLDCSECHSSTVNSAEQIIGVAFHVNGTADVALPAGMVRDATTCTGSCHGESHFSRVW